MYSHNTPRSIYSLSTEKCGYQVRQGYLKDSTQLAQMSVKISVSFGEHLRTHLKDYTRYDQGMFNLIVLNEQFINSCSRELSVHLMEKQLQSLKKLTAIAKQYLTAHHKKLTSCDFNSKKYACASRSEVKNVACESEMFFAKVKKEASATARGLRWFNCGRLEHRESEYAR